MHMDLINWSELCYPTKQDAAAAESSAEEGDSPTVPILPPSLVPNALQVRTSRIPFILSDYWGNQSDKAS